MNETNTSIYNLALPKFYMMIGLPASGKSYYANILQEQGAIVVSSDKMREELYGDINCQDNNEELFQHIRKKIKQELINGNDVAFDACNISYKKRMNFLQELKNIPCIKTAILMATSYEKCLENNLQRERKVPEEVIIKMYKSFYVPQYYEGWDNIEIKYFDNDNPPYVIPFEKILELLDVAQDNPHHTLTIKKHCLVSVDKLMQICPRSCSPELFNATLIHDIGKLFCKTFNEEKGHCTYYGHHLVGAYQSLIYNRCEEKNYKLEVAKYIMWHMQFYFMQGEKAEQKFIKLVGKDFYNNLCLLHSADEKAH